MIVSHAGRLACAGFKVNEPLNAAVGLRASQLEDEELLGMSKVLIDNFAVLAGNSYPNGPVCLVSCWRIERNLCHDRSGTKPTTPTDSVKDYAATFPHCQSE